MSFIPITIMYPTGKELAYRKMEFGKKAKDEPEEEIRRIEQEAHE